MVQSLVYTYISINRRPSLSSSKFLEMKPLLVPFCTPPLYTLGVRIRWEKYVVRLKMFKKKKTMKFLVVLLAALACRLVKSEGLCLHFCDSTSFSHFRWHIYSHLLIFFTQRIAQDGLHQARARMFKQLDRNSNGLIDENELLKVQVCCLRMPSPPVTQLTEWYCYFA